MTDTLTAPASSGSVAAPATPVAPDATNAIAAAGESLKGKTWADAGFPAVAGMDVIDGGADADDLGGDVTSGVAPSDPAAPDKEAAPAAPVVEGEFSQDAEGKWHRPDGTFATADEIAAIDAQIAADATKDVKADETAEPTAGETVTLRMRNGQTREVVIDDPDLAQEIRQNFNDGMRRREYTERMAAVEAREGELAEFQTMLAQNPDGIYEMLPPDVQVRLLARGIAQHFDALVPVIQGYDQNPSSRIAAVAEASRAAREQQTKVEGAMTAQRQASEVKRAVAALIPETVPEETAREFWDFARIKLSQLVDQGVAVTKDTVPQHLAGIVARFGFSSEGAAPAAPTRPRITVAPSAPPAAASAAPSSSPVAVPANDAARAHAERTQRRIKLTQTSRANAAAVPPVGAGAAPVRLPPVPAGASIEDASRVLKTQRNWTS